MSESPASALPRVAPLRLAFGAAPTSGALGLLAHAPGAGLHVPLPALGASAPFESWDGGVVQAGRDGDIEWRADGDWLFASVSLAEAGDAALESATEAVYQRMPEFCAAAGYAQPVKIWHYFAAINRGAGDAERYRRFCVGRARGIGSRRWLAAATAVGAPGDTGPLTIYWLASRHAVSLLENPRQTPAFEYPRAYGPVSPSFARAAWVAASGQLFVSGTAAVVGHESRHANDAVAQLSEIAANLAALVARAEREAALAAGTLKPRGFKVYVRRPKDEPALRAAAETLFPDCPALWLQGDISRSELLVEVEALYGEDP